MAPRSLSEIPSLELETVELEDLVRLVATARPPIYGLFCFKENGIYHLATLLRLHPDSNIVVLARYEVGSKPDYNYISYRLSRDEGEVIEFEFREEIMALNIPLLFLDEKPKLPPPNPRALDVVEVRAADLQSFARLAIGQLTPTLIEEEYRRPTLLWWVQRAEKLLFPFMLHGRETHETMWVASFPTKEAGAFPFLKYIVENGRERAELVRVPTDPQSLYGSIIHVRDFPL